MYQGMLTLKRFPNFENLLVDDRDNIYVVRAMARDHAFNLCTLEITIMVINLS